MGRPVAAAGAVGGHFRGACKRRSRPSQAELAKRLGATQSAVARLEAGGVSPSLATLRRYAEATGTQLRLNLVRAA